MRPIQGKKEKIFTNVVKTAKQKISGQASAAAIATAISLLVANTIISKAETTNNTQLSTIQPLQPRHL